jgi:hypothetical protein
MFSSRLLASLPQVSRFPRVLPQDVKVQRRSVVALLFRTILLALLLSPSRTQELFLATDGEYLCHHLNLYRIIAQI